MALIGISAKKQHGKDTVANIINYLTWVKEHPDYRDLLYEEVKDFGPFKNSQKPYEVKRFADKLKDIVCMIIGCEREQLEDETFKNAPLGKEWWWFAETMNHNKIPYLENEEVLSCKLPVWKMTPRLMLQLLGTEGGRELLHSDIWVNSLMGGYKPIGIVADEIKGVYDLYPNWVIPDMRFTNELERVTKEGGITIRVNRDGVDVIDEHESETALDDATFDYVIENNGSIEELVQKVKEILINEGIL